MEDLDECVEMALAEIGRGGHIPSTPERHVLPEVAKTPSLERLRAPVATERPPGFLIESVSAGVFVEVSP